MRCLIHLRFLKMEMPFSDRSYCSRNIRFHHAPKFSLASADPCNPLAFRLPASHQPTERETDSKLSN